ncbi:molybdopterin-dependent oxidoreductase [Streptomyces nymphaeiformis]|uniref:DMSO/TMAO reductase YedYZ molybdopterin-dependent catalytic subunit n=1 Tax=Streptomyces nymphaeiformis TaxID=2663842 RepID=A0A7W7TVZ4_9ACTN|nr:molybdopterin-dependent oxidoreductase [Streptomyces nymphaeiformis]MBB4980369.1 DMSO/TMAO reductase YedYZ molybdopterin-dependent catalytic subunit [Streptomyces nymphaeiformis]
MNATRPAPEPHDEPRRERPTRTDRLLAALGGLVSAYVSLAVADLVAHWVRPEASPVPAVGGAVVDSTPAPVKEWAIRAFGENDKTVLQLGILLLLALLALGVGLLALRHRLLGAAAVGAFGVFGAVAAVTRPDSGSVTDAVPSLVGAAAGALLLYALIGRLLTPWPGTARADRRGFLIVAASTGLAATGAAAIGRAVGTPVQENAAASRAALVLPRPDSPAPGVPAGARLDVPGLGPFITPNRDFYRVDTALIVPKVDADRWRLRIHGSGVREERTLTLRQLMARPTVERDITLCCVSNEVGGPLVGNARWLGVPLAPLLREAGVRPPSEGGPADQLVARSVDGMTIGTPVEAVMDGRDALLAFGMNGEPLPFTHGFPVRMIVPGLYGYVSACKWIASIELTTFAAYDAYWVPRGWAAQAPVKTQSRIDTPRDGAHPAAGTVMVAGVAWAQHRGIRRVEVRVDDGPWQDARLAAQDGVDTWRQWVHPWAATPGRHTLTVRATDGTGTTQPERRTDTMPDGAQGWHSIDVTVGRA